MTSKTISQLLNVRQSDVELIKLPSGILVDITDYITRRDFARMDYVLRKSPEWNANILSNVKFNFWNEYLPSYVLSWCIRRNIKITGLIAASSSNWHYNGGSQIVLLPEFLQYLELVDYQPTS